MEFKLQLAAFGFRADQGSKLKLELHALSPRNRSCRSKQRPETMKTGERSTVGCPTCGGVITKLLDDN